MGFANQYLEKQKNFKFHINSKPPKDLNFIVVIPCYNEDRLINSLEALHNCHKPQTPVEIVIVINSSLDAENRVKEQNLKTFKEANEWIKIHKTYKFNYHSVFLPDLSPKFAGAGLARKIGMDEAVGRFNLIQNHDGIIISFDADSICDKNYLCEVEKNFNKHPDAAGCSIYFEHPLTGNEFSDEVYKAITLYELNLRYYLQSLRIISFPFAYHTIGSCFAVRASAYVKQGGMNRKKAGEDFYFLHKIIPSANFFEINSTRVIPSPRPSGRVPFGTGAVINKILMAKNTEFMTYNPKSFEDLGRFFKIFPELFKKQKPEIVKIIEMLPEPIRAFLYINNAVNKIEEVNNNCNNIKSFIKRLFSWFNAFKVLKFLNFCTERYYPQINVITAVNTILGKLGLPPSYNYGDSDLLKLLRKYEKRHCN